MKKIWKALGITALAAAVIPYRFRKDKDEGTLNVDALLWQVTHRAGNGEDEASVDISLGFKSPLHEAREESKLFTDDPDEAVLFADDKPEDAVVEAVVKKAEEVAEEVADKVEKVEDKADELEVKAKEVDAADFDPEF